MASRGKVHEVSRKAVTSHGSVQPAHYALVCEERKHDVAQQTRHELLLRYSVALTGSTFRGATQSPNGHRH